MSRAYTIRVSGSLTRVIRAEDHVSTQLELLQILPRQQMADLLGAALAAQGFVREADTVVRTDGKITVSVDLPTLTVIVRAATRQQVEVSGEKTVFGFDEAPGVSKETLRDSLRKELEENALNQQEDLQKQTSDELESRLADLRCELDKAVNSATAEALKQKAAQMGQIKEITEDAQSGALTIVVEV